MALLERFLKRVDPSLSDVILAASEEADARRTDAAIVGGVVRDLLLDKPLHDVDLMLDPPAAPVVEALAKRFAARLVRHDRFFTFTLHFSDGRRFDVVTAREETYEAPAQLPRVTPATIERDLQRRDFTINAIACRLNGSKKGELLDPFLGQHDMTAKILRVLHAQSFVDDPTRIFRAARFAGRLGFAVEPKTESAALASVRAEHLTLLSPARRRHEFELFLKEENPAPGLALLRRWDALGGFLPEWADRDPTEIEPEFRAARSADERLFAWLAPYGRDTALRMMSVLGFEKNTKRDIERRFDTV